MRTVVSLAKKMKTNLISPQVVAATLRIQVPPRRIKDNIMIIPQRKFNFLGWYNHKHQCNAGDKSP